MIDQRVWRVTCFPRGGAPRPSVWESAKNRVIFPMDDLQALILVHSDYK